MSFWDDAWDTLTLKHGEDSIKTIFDPIGTKAIDKAKENEDFEPGSKDWTTKAEKDAYTRRAPTKDNPTVSGARWFDEDTAAGAAGKRTEQNKQLNRVESTAPSYWTNLVNQAAGILGQSKQIYAQNDTPYWQTYATAQASGNIDAWLGGGGSGTDKQAQTTLNGTNGAGSTQYNPYGQYNQDPKAGYTYDANKQEYYAY